MLSAHAVTRRMKLPRFQPKLADFGISCQLQNTWARRNTQIGSCGDPGTVFGVAMSRVHWGYNPEPCFLSLEVHCQIQDPETLKHGFQNYRQSISPDPMSMLGATSSASRGLILPAELQSWHLELPGVLVVDAGCILLVICHSRKIRAKLGSPLLPRTRDGSRHMGHPHYNYPT